MKEKKIKLFEALVNRGLCESSERARSLVMAGQVLVNDQRIDKPGTLIPLSAEVRLKGRKRYVSRGGHKLEGALKDFSLSDTIQGLVGLDIGASTGGFTDCLLQHGASRVYALDVGTNQLDWSLRNDDRVISMEKTNIQDLKEPLSAEIQIVVADISFNSISRLLTHILGAVPGTGAKFLLLIKPQFELPSELVPEGGVVTNQEHRLLACQKVETQLLLQSCENIRFLDCHLPGKTGNREIFVYFTRSEAQSKVSET